MGLLDFREDINSIRTHLRSGLLRYSTCEGCVKFDDCVRELTTKFYPYFNCPSRNNLIKHLLDIQAELELIDQNQRDIEAGSKHIYNVIFTLRALTIEIENLEESLEILYTECQEFWKATKGIDIENRKVMMVLKDVWKVMQDLKEAKYVLSQHQREFIELNIENNLITFTEYINSSDDVQMNYLLKSLGKNSMYFAEAVRQLKYLANLLSNHHRINDIHPMFSFYIIQLINHNVIEKDIKEKNQNKSPFSKCKDCFKKNKQLKNDNELEYSSSMVKCPESTFNSIEKSLVPIGVNVHKITYEIRQFHCAALRRQEIILTAIQAKRLVLMRGLNELHNIMTSMEQMEELNDTLIGKMTKLRPKFERVNEYLKIDLNALEELIEDPENDFTE